MSRIDCTGAELNDLDELDSVTDGAIGGTHVFESSTVQAWAGARSWRARRANNTNGGAEMGVINTPTADPTSFTVKFSMYVPSAGQAPSPDFDPLQLNFGVGEEIHLRLQPGTVSGYRLSVRNGANQMMNAHDDIPYDQWQHFTIRCSIATGVGASDNARLRWLNPTAGATAEFSGNTDFASAGLASVEFGLTDPNLNDADIFFDDIIVDDSLITTDLFAGRFLAFLPPSGDKSAGWGTVGAGASHTARVTDNDDATGVRASGAGAANEELHMTDLAGTMPGSFRAEQLYASVRHGNATDTAAFVLRVRDSADVSQGNVSVAASAVATTKRSVLRINTVGKSQTNINGFYYRMEKAAGLATDQCTVQELWGYLEVAAEATPTDSVTASESPAIRNEFSTTDAAALAESHAIRNEFELTDSAALAEDTPAVRAEMGLDDTASIAEEVSGISNKFPATDDLSIAEQTDIRAEMFVEDTAELSEGTPEIRAEMSLDDSAAVSEDMNTNKFSHDGGTTKKVFHIFDD